MAFKMKGNPFNLGRVATKSGVKMAKKAMKMKTESPMPMRINNTSPMRRLDYEYDGEIIDKATYDQKMEDVNRLKDLAAGGTGVRSESGEYEEGISIYTPSDQATIKSFFPDFMTEKEFEKANPNAVSPGPNTTAYAEYSRPYKEKLKVEAKKQLQDKYAPIEGSVTGDVGSLGKLKATGQDFINELYQEYKKQGRDTDYMGNKVSFDTYIDSQGLREQYNNAVRERKANKQ